MDNSPWGDVSWARPLNRRIWRWAYKQEDVLHYWENYATWQTYCLAHPELIKDLPAAQADWKRGQNRVGLATICMICVPFALLFMVYMLQLIGFALLGLAIGFALLGLAVLPFLYLNRR